MRIFLLAGLAFGDEGKGSMVDFLCRYHGASLVVRYNGGPQAGHNVVLTDGRHHTFSQFGSGTFIPGVETYLSEHMLIEPYAMMNEARVLTGKGVGDALDRVSINPKSIIITPWHWRANRIRELYRGAGRHGSCGMGVGEARKDQLEEGLWFEVSDIQSPYARERLQGIKHLKLNECRDLVSCDESAKIYSQMEAEDPKDVLLFYLRDWWRSVRIKTWDDFRHSNIHTSVFEGAQGVLLDETHGFGQYTTWTDCTFNNAYEIINHYGADLQNEIIRIGVTRTYFTRHGAGPFVTEEKDGVVPGIANPEDINNPENAWQGKLRVGHLDCVALRYSLKVIGGVDYIALTHRDLVDLPGWRCCTAYVKDGELHHSLTKELVEAGDIGCVFTKLQISVSGSIEQATKAKIGYMSWGPSCETKFVMPDICGMEEAFLRKRTCIV